MKMIRTKLSRLILSALLVSMASACTNNTEMVLRSEIKDCGKLVLAEMSIRKVGKIKDKPVSESTGLKSFAMSLVDAVKPGDRVAVYSYDTYLRAYVDLTQLADEDIEINENSRTLTLTLPPMTTEFAGRDFEFNEEHYRVSGLRSDVSVEERAELKEKMSASLRKEIEADRMFVNTVSRAAQEKADAYFKAFLAPYGYQVTVKFTPKTSDNEEVVLSD